MAFGEEEEKEKGSASVKENGVVYAMGMVGCTGIHVVSKCTVEVI